MSKYIIKNCPVYNTKHSICNKKSKVIKCSDITDCLLKQIVEKCKKAINTYDNGEYYEDDVDTFMGESIMAQSILDLLDISEVE